MDGETLPPPAEMDGTTQTAASDMEGEIQQPAAAEMEGETQQPPAEMEGETQPPPPPLPACVSKVLDDDNLLLEIIVRVGFPTTLVRAAAVCRRWLGLASDRAFLRRFRKLHPPRLLGFYLAQREYPDAAARFFPVLPQPPPPELAAVVRRASFSLDFYYGARTSMVACWNGRVVTSLQETQFYSYDEVLNKFTFVLHSPLCSERGMVAIPALNYPLQEGNFFSYAQLFSKEEGDVVSYFYVIIVESHSHGEAKSTVQVFMLQNGDDVWRTHLTMNLDYRIYARSRPRSVLVDNKIYMPTAQKIVVLDLTASSFSTFQLPPGVDIRTKGSTMLSRADDASALYLIHAKELQLYIWLHKGGNWLLVDKICLREVCAPLLEDDPAASLRINHVGDYTTEFLFLAMGRSAFFLDVKCRTLRKVYEMTRESRHLGRIYPYMMIWPPIFPALKDGPTSNATT